MDAFAFREIGRGGAAANIGVYGRPDEMMYSRGDDWTALNDAKNDQRREGREAARAARPELVRGLAALGVTLHYNERGRAAADTYELWHAGKRWGYWWPAAGKTRVGNTLGPVCRTADALLEYVRARLTAAAIPLAPVKVQEEDRSTLKHYDFACWLAERLPASVDAKVWQPKDKSFSRVYMGNSEYVHVNQKSLRYSCDELEQTIKAALAKLGAKLTRAGFSVPNED